MTITHVGFTGTRKGLTNQQLMQVHQWLGDLQTLGARQAHHGCCLGGDSKFHWLARALNYRLIGHPGVLQDGSDLDRDWHAQEQCHEVREERWMLDRNEDIVIDVDVMIACPGQKEEQMRGSGTWQAMRIARKREKPLLVVFPDGAIDCSEPWYEQFRTALKEAEAAKLEEQK